MITQLISSILCLLIFLGIYKVMLQKESMHQFNRFYLILSIVISFLIPFVTIEVASQNIVTPTIFPESAPGPLEDHSLESTFQPIASNFNWVNIGVIIYFLVSALLFFRFLKSLLTIYAKIRKSQVVGYKGQTLVLVDDEILPFTFLNYIFVSESDFYEGKFTEPIFIHEATHARQFHTLDIIFIELLLVIFWFHPALYLAKEAVKLNHEFIADGAALRIISAKSYKKLLVSMISPNQTLNIISSLKFSFTKKRLDMMNKKTNPSIKLIKVLSLIPVLALAIFVFSGKVPAQHQGVKAKTLNYFSESEQKGPQDFTLEVKVFPNGDLEFNGENHRFGSFDKNLKENLAKRDDSRVLLNIMKGTPMGVVSDLQQKLFSYGATHIDLFIADQKLNNPEKAEFYKDATFVVVGENGVKTKKNYKELTEQQKADLPGPMAVPVKKTPKVAEFEKWKDVGTYAVWIDGVSVKNERLGQINESDIAFYIVSFVHLNARSERFPQEYQVHAYTHAGYEKAYGKNSDFMKNRNWTITIKE